MQGVDIRRRSPESTELQIKTPWFLSTVCLRTPAAATLSNQRDRYA